MKKYLVPLLFLFVVSCWSRSGDTLASRAHFRSYKIGEKIENERLQIVFNDYSFSLQNDSSYTMQAYITINGEIDFIDFDNFEITLLFGNKIFNGSFDYESFYLDNGCYLEPNCFYFDDYLFCFKLDKSFDEKSFPAFLLIDFSSFYCDGGLYRLYDKIIYKEKK